jgi:hypothetical protein
MNGVFHRPLPAVHTSCYDILPSSHSTHPPSGPLGCGPATLHGAQYGRHHAIFVFIQSMLLTVSGIPTGNIFMYRSVGPIKCPALRLQTSSKWSLTPCARSWPAARNWACADHANSRSDCVQRVPKLRPAQRINPRPPFWARLGTCKPNAVHVSKLRKYPHNRVWSAMGLWYVKDWTLYKQPARRWRWGCQP